MITDARALRHEHPPQELEHRDGQIGFLSALWDPLTRGNPGEHVCVHGPSGAGKTTLVKHTLSKLKAQTFGVRWGYVNCMSDSTTASALYQLVRDAGLGADLRREGTPTSVTLDYIRECDDQLVIVLDEVDLLDDIQTVLSLFECANVTLVCITLSQDKWLASLDPRAKSRLQGFETLQLEKYTHTELLDILDVRVEHGLARSEIADGTLDRVADIAAGDARYAITLLRKSARHAELEERDLTPEIVEDNIPEAEADMRDHRRRYYGTHKTALLTIIEEAGEIGVSELHSKYERRVQEPKARSTRRRYLAFLKRYDDIECTGNGPAKTYRSVS